MRVDALNENLSVLNEVKRKLKTQRPEIERKGIYPDWQLDKIGFLFLT